MNPCKVKKSKSGMVCLCHGAKTKWKDGVFYCIATDADVRGTDWTKVHGKQKETA